MPDITVTVPPDKVDLVRASVEYATRDMDMTDQEIMDWIEGKFIIEIRRVVRRYLDSEHFKTFVFIDPVS